VWSRHPQVIRGNGYAEKRCLSSSHTGGERAFRLLVSLCRPAGCDPGKKCPARRVDQGLRLPETSAQMMPTSLNGGKPPCQINHTMKKTRATT
jgi:hypothetical protein